MKKDGTVYLVLVRNKVGVGVGWELLSWKTPVALSDERGKKGWCTQLGFKLRNFQILESYAIETVLKTISRKPKKNAPLLNCN